MIRLQISLSKVILQQGLSLLENRITPTALPTELFPSVKIADGIIPSVYTGGIADGEIFFLKIVMAG